ncbi:hypothetical protein PV327_010805 [Microctonus hyperodae]|uniref:Peroxisomal membrane protein PEX16 n=1 Tax=Microctonus hyperodae TaxID=165561 RepID=A0AA39F0D0_MICHY|nr:hypothetical protein PV327_010805 [Microctonus hyperodae]
MELMNNNFKIYLHAYKHWISSKPKVIADIESTIRCFSYFTAGRFTHSSFISELIYSLPNLFILINDCLIYNEKYVHLNLSQYKSKLKIWLTIIEYIEALIEISAKKLWGDTGKWMIIFVVQAFKAIMRLIIVHRNIERITCNPAIPVLNREKLNEWQKEDFSKNGFILKRSGVVIRCVNATEPYKSRIWAPLMPVTNNNSSTECETQITTPTLLLAETLYIIKPLIHLINIMVKGNKNWLPWATALTMDIISLKLISRETLHSRFVKEEREEICRRRINLLLYILRSPFYDKCSKTKINSLLNFVCNNVPFGKLIGEPMVKYLPHWQETYFYMWSH